MTKLRYPEELLAEKVKELEAENAELRDALLWYLNEDDTNEGDEPLEQFSGQSWDEINEYWLVGKNRARRLLGVTK